ncbi:MAG: TonB-dependent receptor [Gemmatimonadetes bacterium]|nr:TonB-dependent receptor [Gemmatimonadota bacterium]
MAQPLVGQESYLIAGRVTDTEGRAVGGATIELSSGYQSTLSRLDGHFELRVPAGMVQLRASRIGYTPATVTIALAEGAVDSLLIRLQPIPIHLQGVSVEAPRAPPMAHTVTAQTVRQVPPLAEPDIFRAVVLLPGVSQPNDLKGRIHLAGGASDETGIYLDGHPLQDPFHLLGLLGAFNVAALDRADLLIHHLPPSAGGRLSGIIDLQTRRPGEEPAYEAVASLVSTGLTVTAPPVLGGMDLLASGRITYLDRIADWVYPEIPPLDFREALVRIGRGWAGGWRAEALVFSTQDRYTDRELSASPGYQPLTWGESLLGLRLDRRGMIWDVSGRASFNRATVHMDERTIDVDSLPFSRSNFIHTRRDWLSGALQATRTAERWELIAGASLDQRQNQQMWTAQGLMDEIFSPNTPGEYSGEQMQSLFALFGEARVQLGKRWTVAPGARAWSAGGIRIAPRAHLGFRASEALEIEAALDRRYQWDTQLEEPVEGSITPPLFLLEEPRTADVVAVSARLRPAQLPYSGTSVFHVQAFRKEYRDRTLLNARESRETEQSVDPDFPVFDRVTGHSTGAALSAKIAFRADGLLQGSYSYQRVRENVDGLVSPTAWDAPHTVVLFGSAPLGARWTLNASYQGHSGRATTPVLARTFEPFSTSLTELRSRYLRGARNSIRVPAYHRIDLGARREWHVRNAEVTLALQALNLLARENPIDYDWQHYFGRLSGSNQRRAGRAGLPFLPSIGMEVKW